MQDAPPDDDDALLDEAFDRALRAVEEGTDAAIEDLAARRPAMRARLVEVVHLARASAMQRAPVLPRVSGYEAVRELGRGGMGVVYLARHQALDRLVALKVLLTTGPGSARQRFLSEARAIARVRHPHVVQIHDVIDDAQNCAFAMEYVDGRSLGEILGACEGAPPGERLARAGSLLGASLADRGWTAFVVRIGVEIADALAAVHALGLVHRDVKPSNVLVRKDGTACLADFGLVHDASSAELTRSGQFVGTLLYASPEQLSGRREEIGPRSDVYSLGATLYHALALRPPFAEPSTPRMLARIEAGGALPIRRFDRTVPRDLEVVVAQAIDPDPARRYANAAALACDLRNVLELRPIAARRPSVLLQARRWTQRHPTWAMALLLTVAALSVGSVALRWQLTAEARRAQMPTDRLLIAGLLEEVPDLLPGGSNRIPAMVRWLDQSRLVLSRMEDYRHMWLEVSARELPADAVAETKRLAQIDAEIARDRACAAFLRQEINRPDGQNLWLWEWLCHWVRALEERIASQTEARALPATMRFALPEDDRLSALLTEMLSRATRLVAAERVLVARLESTRSGDATFATALATTWPRVCRMVSDVQVMPKYRGEVVLAPQQGLVPLGVDPASGLFEFAHLATGEIPFRDPDSGRLRITEDTGVVLVLLPGGTTTMGSRPPGPGDVDGVGYVDSLSHPEEQPPGEVTLEPFFLSKFEMTQAQWLRVTAQNPSWFAIGQLTDGRTITGMHPVDSVTWEEARRVLRSLDLALPTDAQWEYACRAGTTTRYWTGVEDATLEGAENIADVGSEVRRGMARNVAETSARNHVRVPWDDGWLRHAPIGTFRSNPFGLFDMQGNVGEWCQDIGPNQSRWMLLPARAGDSRRETPPASWVTIARGACWNWGAYQARSACRPCSIAEQRHFRHGVRPARAVQR